MLYEKVFLCIAIVCTIRFGLLEVAVEVISRKESGDRQDRVLEQAASLRGFEMRVMA